MGKAKIKGKKSSSEMSDLISQINKNNGRMRSLKAEINETQEFCDEVAELRKTLDLKEKLIEAGGEGSAQISAGMEQIKKHEHDMLSNYSHKSGLESNTLKQISGNEIRGLEQKSSEMIWFIEYLKRTSETSKSVFSELKNKLYNAEKEASEKINALTAQVDNLQKDLLTLPKTKEELESYCEKIKEEHAETLAVVSNERNELANKNKNLQRTLKERENAYQKLSEKYKKVDSRFNECKVKLEVADRKMEEMAKEFREGIQSKDQMVADLEHQVDDLKRGLKEKGDENSIMVGNIRNLGVRLRMSNQKLRGTEKLLREKEESFKKADEKFQQDQRAIENRIAAVVAAVTADNEAFRETTTIIKECVYSVISGIDTMSRKFLDESKNLENIFLNISHELQGAKEYVRQMNREMRKLEKDKNRLFKKLQSKKEEELTLRGKFSLESKSYKNIISNISHELQVAKESVSKMTKVNGELQKEKNLLLEELQGKKKEELTLIAKVEKLGGKAKEEESEKMDLNATVVELKKTVEGLEKLMKEREEGMREEKREAIRQLCMVIDYHREQNDYLKEIILKTRRVREKHRSFFNCSFDM